MIFEHHNPVKLVFGAGVRARLRGECRGKTLLVTGRQTLERCGWTELLDEQIQRSSAVAPNPGDAEIDQLVQEGLAMGAETVVGLGGGSTMDAAKVVALLLHNWSDIAQYRGCENGSRPRRVRLIQVPTTAGTGSEVTRWASVWNSGVKSSVDESEGFADLALIDPELCRGMPPRLALCTGLDAMSHAMESLWGVHRTPISQGYAVRALGLLVEHLEAACSGRTDDEMYEALALASLLAGLALSCTRSAAAHALSYELTGRFGLEHGLGVGLLCKSLLQWNQPAAPEGVALIVSAMGYETVEQAQDFIDRCFKKAGLMPQLFSFGVSARDFPDIIGQASASHRLGNNPGSLDQATLLKVLEAIA